MKSEEKSFNEAIYIPFNDFKFSFDNNISEVFCHVNEKQKSLECVIIKTGIKLFALSISLEKIQIKNLGFIHLILLIIYKMKIIFANYISTEYSSFDDYKFLLFYAL